MKAERLRLNRILHRNLNSFRKQHPELSKEPSVEEDARRTSEEFIHRLNEVHESDGVSLLDLFNVGLVDFVNLRSGHYRAVDWPKQATHKLVGTSWNNEPTRAMPNPRFALSVCAMPLRPHHYAPALSTRRVISIKETLYTVSARIEGKRNVLRTLLTQAQAKLPLRVLLRMTSKECDLLYQQLVRANRMLILKKALS